MKHPKIVENFSGSLDDLAKSVGSMSYDSVSYFLGALADDLKRQSCSDEGKGRVKLASHLFSAAQRIYESKEEISKAWKICEPYMK